MRPGRGATAGQRNPHRLLLEFFRVLDFGGENSTAASLDNLLDRLARNEFDLVAVGRALISDPRWVENIRTGSENLKGFDAAALAELV